MFKVGDFVELDPNEDTNKLYPASDLSIGTIYCVERQYTGMGYVGMGYVGIENDRGNIEGYVEKRFMLNHKMSAHTPESVAGSVTAIACECGKDKHGFASHSSWCPIA